MGNNAHKYERTQMIIKRIPVVLATAVLMSCSGGGGSGGGSGTAIGNVGTGGAGGSFSDIASASGGWTTSCIQQTNVQTISKASTSGNSLVMVTEEYYDNATCAQNDKFSTRRATYSVSTSGTNTVATNSTNIDMTLTKLEVYIHEPAHAQNQNTGSVCGKNDWVSGQWIDITNTSCFDSAPYYTIFRINGNNLNFGDTSGMNDGSTEQKRPTSLDMGFTFTK